MNNLFYTSLVVIGIILGSSLTRDLYRYDAIQSGGAEYNMTTGEFAWKEKVVCLSQK